MKNLSSFLSLAAGVVVASQAHASLITGDISFAGSTTLNSSVPASTAYNSFVAVTVGDGTQTGAYAGTDGLPVTFTGLTYLSGGLPAPIVGTPTLWSFKLGATVYDFKVTSLDNVTKDTSLGITSVSIWGSGIAQISGYTDTPGQFSLVLTGKKAKVTFAAYTVAVPEPTSWALVSGLGLAGFAFYRRARK
jgi:hypothetical protein